MSPGAPSQQPTAAGGSMPPLRLRARAPMVLALHAALLLIACAWSSPSQALQFTRTNYPTGSQPRGVAIGDLNKDGHPDVVTANQGSNTITVYLGNGSGGLGSRADYVVGSGPFSVAIGDLDGDGNPDVVVANLSSSNVSVLRGNGTG